MSAAPIYLSNISQDLPLYAQFQIPRKINTLNKLQEAELQKRASDLQKRIFELNLQHLFKPLCTEFENEEISVMGMVHDDGLGDYYHIVAAGDEMQKRFPQFKIRLMPIFMSKEQMESVKLRQKPVFENDFYFYTEIPQEAFEKIKKAGFVLEISQPIPNDELASIREQMGERFQFIGEYGDWRKPAMGLGPEDEGIFIKNLTKASLLHLNNAPLKTLLFANQTPTEKDLENYHQKQQLFFGYLKMSHLFQLGYLYSTIVFQSKGSKDIDLFMPLENLKQLDEWKLIDREFLKEQGIKRITLIKKSEEQTIEVADEGKEVRLINPFPLPQEDFHLSAMNSQFYKGCTGDQSFSEMIPDIDASEDDLSLYFYEIRAHKFGFFESLKALVKEQCGQGDLLTYLSYLEQLYNPSAARVFEKPESYKASEISDFMKSLLPKILETSKKIGLLLTTSSSLPQEVRKINTLIRKYFSFNENLTDLVAHRLATHHHSELKKFESELYQEYCTGSKDLFQVHEIMKEKIKSMSHA